MNISLSKKIHSIQLGIYIVIAARILVIGAITGFVISKIL